MKKKRKWKVLTGIIPYWGKRIGNLYKRGAGKDWGRKEISREIWL